MIVHKSLLADNRTITSMIVEHIHLKLNVITS